MAIYQPTNITPDLISGVKNGVVMIPASTTDPVTISWSVNGNSKLVKYQIDFYRNLPNESTPIMSTGEVTLGTPFSAVAADGTVQRFSCTVPYSYLQAAAVALSGYTGKMKITQWWSTGSVAQRSLSVFRVAPQSSFGITGVSGYNGIYHFTGAFSNVQTQTTLLWTRWTAECDGNTVYDTGKVWGATGYEWSPGVFYPGHYTVTFSAESSNGEELSDTASLEALESNVTIEGLLQANCDYTEGAVGVDINQSPDSVSIIGSVTGSPIVTESEMTLGRDDSITWSIPEYLYGNEWAFVWEGNTDFLLGSSERNIVEVTQRDGSTFGIRFDGTGLWMVFPNTTQLTTQIAQGEIYRFVVLKDETLPTPQYVCYFGIYEDRSQDYSRSFKSMLQFEAGDITSVTLRGEIGVYKWGIIYGSVHTNLLNYTSDYDVRTPYGDGPYLGWEPVAGTSGEVAQIYFPFDLVEPLYRKNPNGSITKIAEITPGEQYPIVYDFGAANGQEYQYFLLRTTFSNNEREQTATIMLSDTITPCFWEWDIIEAESTIASGENTAYYTPVNVFRFRANVTSGSIGNGASPSVYSTFTRYPVVLRDTQNRKSGTLTGLIGWVTAPGEYSDSNEVMDAIRNLSATKNTLFLRSRRGEFLKIAVSGEISTSANDNSAKQEITASVPWVEIGPVDGSVASFKAINTEGV